MMLDRLGISLEFEPQFLGSFPAFDAERFSRDYELVPGAGQPPTWMVR